MRNYTDPDKRGEFVGVGYDKLGNEVELFWATDIEPPNRGFVAHIATAWRDGKPAGFLRTEHVDVAEHARLNPTIWNHMRSFGGFSGMNEDEDPSKFTDDRQAKFQRDAFHSLGFYNREEEGTYEEFMTVVEKTRIFKERQSPCRSSCDITERSLAWATSA